MKHQDCHCAQLASSELGHVAACQHCGQVQLNLPYLTLRFQADEFRTLSAMLHQAQRRIDAAARNTAMPAAAAGTLH
ncbi:MAG: hypothetical protein HYZ65_02905 [Burkholderiales bacterium]|nr:hypothetical protein [Burkholderiales bacterium]